MQSVRATAWTVALVLSLATTIQGAEGWTPALWADENTLDLRTTGEGPEPYWFPVWLAVVDDQLYVRLGSRATERIESNTTKPEVGVRIAGQEFPRVRGEPAPEMAERVAAEMAEKYWTDAIVRYVAHPLTLRLVPVN
jgi:hypothetical protein